MGCCCGAGALYGFRFPERFVRSSARRAAGCRNRTALLEGRAFSPLRRLGTVVWGVAAVRNTFRRKSSGDTCGSFARTSSGRQGRVCTGGNRLPDEGTVHERWHTGVPVSWSRFPDRRGYAVRMRIPSYFCRGLRKAAEIWRSEVRLRVGPMGCSGLCTATSGRDLREHSFAVRGF